MKFRKRPVVIEAFQLTAETRKSNENWPNWLHEAWNKGPNELGTVYPYKEGDGEGPVHILTLEGAHRCDLDDWIIQGIHGELYPCKPDIFEATYEPAEGESELTKLREVNAQLAEALEAVGDADQGIYPQFVLDALAAYESLGD